jgi:hypothetical protein
VFHHRRALAGAIPLIAAFAILAGIPAAAQAGTSCPSMFQVLHNDRIGSLQLPAGKYELRVDSISCSRASSLFTVFLNDWDGKLPSGWSVKARGRGHGLFTRGSAAFAVEYQSSGGNTGGLTCSTPYRVTAPTQAGLLALPAGNYRLTRLSAVSPTCSQSAALLTSFLGLTQQVLPGGWISLFEDGAFVQNSATYGFRASPL